MFATSFFTKLALAGATAAAIATTALPASAQVYNGINYDQRLINRDARDGRISYWQQRNLDDRLHRIEAQRNYDLSRNGGYLTPGERARLDWELQQERNQTYRDQRYHYWH